MFDVESRKILAVGIAGFILAVVWSVKVVSPALANGVTAFYASVLMYLGFKAWSGSRNVRFIRWLSASLFVVGSACALRTAWRVKAVFAGSLGQSEFWGAFEYWLTSGGVTDIALAVLAVYAWTLAALLAKRLPMEGEEMS